MNRIDPGLSSAMFQSWAEAMRPGAPALVAIDSKTSRGSLGRTNGCATLHLVSAFATREKLVLAQEGVADEACKQSTIPLQLERLADKGHLAGADYLLAVKASQPGLMGEIKRLFADPRADVHTAPKADKGHGRVEERKASVSTCIDWLDCDRRFPGEYRLP